MEEIAVLDFETTGLSAGLDRPTEIAVVIVRDGEAVDRYQSLMNPGCRIPWEVQRLTGISDEMVRDAPPVEAVMREAAAFVSGRPLVAHNAAFDRRFWSWELERIGIEAAHAFACTLLLARRVYPEAGSHRLGHLSAHLGLYDTGRAHRALADVLTTVQLWNRICEDVGHRHAIDNVDHALLMQVQSRPRQAVPGFLQSCGQRACAVPAH